MIEFTGKLHAAEAIYMPSGFVSLVTLSDTCYSACSSTRPGFTSLADALLDLAVPLT